MTLRLTLRKRQHSACEWNQYVHKQRIWQTVSQQNHSHWRALLQNDNAKRETQNKKNVSDRRMQHALPVEIAHARGLLPIEMMHDWSVVWRITWQSDKAALPGHCSDLTYTACTVCPHLFSMRTHEWINGARATHWQCEPLSQET